MQQHLCLYFFYENAKKMMSVELYGRYTFKIIRNCQNVFYKVIILFYFPQALCEISSYSMDCDLWLSVSNNLQASSNLLDSLCNPLFISAGRIYCIHLLNRIQSNVTKEWGKTLAIADDGIGPSIQQSASNCTLQHYSKLGSGSFISWALQEIPALNNSNLVRDSEAEDPAKRCWIPVLQRS